MSPLPIQTPEETEVISSLVSAIHGVMVERKVNPILAVDAAMNFAGKTICEHGASRGAPLEAVVGWTDEACKVLLRLVEQNYDAALERRRKGAH
jgi:hypothetical protein